MKQNTYKEMIIDNQIVWVANNPNTLTYKISNKTHHIIVLLYTKTIESTIDIEFTLPGSSAQIIGIISGSGHEKISLHTRQCHLVPDSISRLLVKSVLYDSSVFSYEGSIYIKKNAQKTDAYQRNENLLLSKYAYAQSSPRLEILANDVRCTHGATISTVSEDQLFYLKSRAIPEQQAKLLIADGFIHDALNQISSKNVQNAIDEFYKTSVYLRS